MGVLSSRLLVAAAANVPEGGRLVPFVEVSRALLRASVFFVEFYANKLLFHVAVEHTVDILTGVGFGRLTVPAATTTATVRRSGFP